MAKHTLKILRCEHRKIFKVCLTIFQHYEIKGLVFLGSGYFVKNEFFCVFDVHELFRNKIFFCGIQVSSDFIVSLGRFTVTEILKCVILSFVCSYLKL